MVIGYPWHSWVDILALYLCFLSDQNHLGPSLLLATQARQIGKWAFLLPNCSLLPTQRWLHYSTHSGNICFPNADSAFLPKLSSQLWAVPTRVGPRRFLWLRNESQTRPHPAVDLRWLPLREDERGSHHTWFSGAETQTEHKIPENILKARF